MIGSSFTYICNFLYLKEQFISCSQLFLQLVLFLRMAYYLTVFVTTEVRFQQMLVCSFHHLHLLRSMYSQFILTMFETGIENLAIGTFSSNFQGMKISHFILYWGWPLRNRGLCIKWHTLQLSIAFKGLEKDIGRP